MDNSFIWEFNHFFGPFLPAELWFMIEIVFGVLLFIICIFQRVYIPSLQTSDQGVNWFTTKLGQIGIWFQSLMGLLTMVDAYWSLINNHNNIHCMITFWCIASVFVKINVLMAVLNGDKKHHFFGVSYIGD